MRVPFFALPFPPREYLVSSPMPRFKVTLEYEGTRYSGWQVQKNARTVQGEIQGAIGTVFNTKEFEFSGSGRTDAGVHALRQVAHLEIITVLAPEIIRMKINDLLPSDINILDVVSAPHSFHARHDAKARSYLYQISRRRSAFGKRFVWWVKDALDIDRMRTAASLFSGLKDFRSFTADDPDEKSTKVQLDPIEIEEAGDLILIRVVGSHFIWKMVRQIVGVLAEVGRGKMSPAEVERLLVQHSNIPAPLTAPPSGLFLERVFYQGDTQEYPLEPMIEVESLSRTTQKKKRRRSRRDAEKHYEHTHHDSKKQKPNPR
jgi:tRNA pseudouridine38-40 synthase